MPRRQLLASRRGSGVPAGPVHADTLVASLRRLGHHRHIETAMVTELYLHLTASSLDGSRCNASGVGGGHVDGPSHGALDERCG